MHQRSQRSRVLPRSKSLLLFVWLHACLFLKVRSSSSSRSPQGLDQRCCQWVCRVGFVLSVPCPLFVYVCFVLGTGSASLT